MELNNFKQLEEELIRGKEAQMLKVQNNLNQSRSIFQSIGDMVELFLPRIIDVFVRMTSNKSESGLTSKYPHEN